MRNTSGRRPVSLLAFDWNGTLVDDAERARGATNQVLDEHGLPPLSRAGFRRAFALPMRRFFVRIGLPEDRHAVAERRWNEEMAAGTARLSVGAEEILRAAAERGVRVVVVSAAATEAVQRDVGRLRIDHLLTDVVGSAQDKAAELTRLVAAEEGEVIYVGDVEYDIRAAVTAGALPVGFGGGYRPAAALAAAGAQLVVWNLAVLRPFLAEVPV